MKNAVVLWTGGKDSALAFYESIDKYNIVKLVTFIPELEKDFIAHPIELMKAQSDSIGLDHECVKIKQPYEESYIDALTQIKNSGIDVVITGDISTINNYPNWIEQCSNGLLEVDMPLWKYDRRKLLKKIELNDFEIVCSLSYKKYFDKTITGKFFDKNLINKLIELEEKTGIDPCGENGEYHTCVLNAPFFKYKLDLKYNIQEMPDYFSIKIEKINKVMK